MQYDLLPASLKEIRESLGHTQQSWADLLGVKVSSVKSWEAEAGVNIPSYRYQIKISEIAGIDFRISAQKKHPAYKD